MPRYFTCVTVTSHLDDDQAALFCEQRIVQLLNTLMPGSRVDVTTYAEKPLPKARMH